MVHTITGVRAREILDSRGTPTVEAEVTAGGLTAVASVPSGASVGEYEAFELRDGDTNRFQGKGVLKAVEHIDGEIADALKGMDVKSQGEIDRRLIVLDGTPNKSRLGANAILAVSMAVARVAAMANGLPLYENLAEGRQKLMPVPMMNILNGGAHASNNLDIQEFMIMPVGASTFSEGLRFGVEVYMTLKKVLQKRKLSTTVGDEGGFAPNLSHDTEAIQVILEAIIQAGFQPGKDVALALDAAVSGWAMPNGTYRLPKTGKELDRAGLCEYWQRLTQDYSILSLEDGMGENDEEGWSMLTKAIGSKVRLVGDDLFVTNQVRIRRGLEKGMANSVLIKLNQIGTVTEAMDAVRVSRGGGYTSVISHRSGETEDTFIADFAVAMGCGLIKTGAPARSERTSKYNRLLKIESELSNEADYPGLQALKST